MTRPSWEVADVIRIAGSRFRERYGASLTWPQVKVLRAIARCRTAALGGHLDVCTGCGYITGISYNSCRNRHCPKCQTGARDTWLAKRQQELLPVNYFHLVFSVPHSLVPLIWQNKKILFTLLFDAAAATLLEVAADPKHLGAEIGFLSILHTWGQTLQPHPHIHCVVPGGGLSPDHERWRSTPAHFFLPVRVLSRVFRGKFVAGLRRVFRANQLAFYGDCLSLANQTQFAAHSCAPCFEKTGSSTPSHRLAVPNMSCTIWLAIRIAWLFPITAFSRSAIPTSPSDGRTMHITTSSAPCL